MRIYRAAYHKTDYQGRPREIYLGPQAQAVVKPSLKDDLSAHLFVPAEAENRRNLERRRKRRLRLWPRDMKRKRKRHPRRPPGQV